MDDYFEDHCTILTVAVEDRLNVLGVVKNDVDVGGGQRKIKGGRGDGGRAKVVVATSGISEDDLVDDPFNRTLVRNLSLKSSSEVVEQVLHIGQRDRRTLCIAVPR